MPGKVSRIDAIPPDNVREQIALCLANFPVGAIKTGKVRALANLGEKRVPALPDLPTLAEQGYPNVIIDNSYNLWAPAGTPKDVVTKLNGEIVKVLAQPDMRERLAGLGLDPVGNSPDEFAAFQKAEIAKWAKVVRDAKITVD